MFVNASETPFLSSIILCFYVLKIITHNEVKSKIVKQQQAIKDKIKLEADKDERLSHFLIDTLSNYPNCHII
jgi:hypothetical protein